MSLNTGLSDMQSYFANAGITGVPNISDAEKVLERIAIEVAGPLDVGELVEISETIKKTFCKDLEEITKDERIANPEEEKKSPKAMTPDEKVEHFLASLTDVQNRIYSHVSLDVKEMASHPDKSGADIADLFVGNKEKGVRGVYDGRPMAADGAISAMIHSYEKDLAALKLAKAPKEEIAEAENLVKKTKDAKKQILSRTSIVAGQYGRDVSYQTHLVDRAGKGNPELFSEKGLRETCNNVLGKDFKGVWNHYTSNYSSFNDILATISLVNSVFATKAKQEGSNMNRAELTEMMTATKNHQAVVGLFTAFKRSQPLLEKQYANEVASGPEMPGKINSEAEGGRARRAA